MGCFNQKRTGGGQLDRNLIRELLTSGGLQEWFCGWIAARSAHWSKESGQCGSADLQERKALKEQFTQNWKFSHYRPASHADDSHVKVKPCRSVLLNTERKNNNYKTYKMSPHSSSSEIQTFTSPEVINECEQMLFTELICKKKDLS